MSKLTDQTDEWYDKKYAKVDRMMVEAMGELFYEYTDQAKATVGRLTEKQRSDLVGLIFPKAEEEEEAPPKKKSKSSRASKGSTAAARKTG